MQEILSSLIKLQKIDSQIYEINKTLSEFPKRVQERQEALDERATNLQALDSQLTALRDQRKEREESLKADEDRLKKWEKRLSESKKHHEASTLAREIDAQKRLNQEVQEDILRLLEQEETLKQKVDLLKKDVAELKQLYAEAKALCEEKTASFGKQIAALDAERIHFTPHIKPALLQKYETIKKRRHGLAVAPAREGCCTGCNMNLPHQLYNIILQAKTLETCPSCQRILYSEEGLEHGIS